jgi:1-acyl-sn-glycerol-3-phosphate acyltransferase
LLRSRHSATAWRLFERLHLPRQRRRLHAILAEPFPEVAAGEPLLLAANHVSWWDGFALREIHVRLRPGAPLLTPMRADQLARFPFLRWLGALPLDPARPASLLGMARLLTRERALHPEVCVSFFPQGRIGPSTTRPLGFRRGVELLARALHPVTILPVGIHLEPLRSPAPTLFLAFGEPLRSADMGAGEGAPAPSAGLARTAPGGSAPVVAAAEIERRVTGALDRLLSRLQAEGEEVEESWEGPSLHRR